MATTRIEVREYGSNGKMSRASVHSADLTAGNIAAQVGLAEDLRDAIDGVSIGNLGETAITHFVSDGGGAPAASPLAQRENKWLVSCRETSAGFNPVTFTIPAADLTLLATDGENMADGAPKAALVAAVEAFVLSNDGVAVNVESIKFRGRTL